MKTKLIALALLLLLTAALPGCQSFTERKAIGSGYAAVSLAAVGATTALNQHWISAAEAQRIKTDLDVANAALDEWARQVALGNTDAISKAASAASVALQAVAIDTAKTPKSPATAPTTQPGGTP